MARETTSKYTVKVKFNNLADKFNHIFRTLNKYDIKQTFNVTQIGENPPSSLHDRFDLTVKFEDDQDKFKDYFATIRVNSFTAKNINNGLLFDEFEVEAIHNGGKRDFSQSFRPQSAEFTFEPIQVSSHTKNLGVLDPIGPGEAPANIKEVLNILRLYINDILVKAGYERQEKIPSEHDKKKFSIAILGGQQYFQNWDSRVVCVSLAGWKIGFSPVNGEENKFQIYVSYPDPRPRYKSCHQVVTSDFSLPGRVTPSKDRYSHALTYEKYFLGDPNLVTQLTTFFNTISQTSSKKVNAQPA